MDFISKDILLLLTDRWADWEAAYAIAQIHSEPQYTVKTVALDKEPKASIGGLRAEIDCVISDYTFFENTALVIVPGGFSWAENEYAEIVEFLKKARQCDVPVAAICGATIFLGRHGFLDDVKHTGDSLEFFTAQAGYRGQKNFVNAQLVHDGGFITANETAAVDFAFEIFKLLEIDERSALEEWRDTFKLGFVR